MKTRVGTIVVACAAAWAATVAYAQQHFQLAVAEGPVLSLDIPHQPLATALPELGRQADVDVVFYADIGKDTWAPALKGRYTAEEALRTLLADTRLEAEFTSPRVVVIRVAEATVSPKPPATTRTGSAGRRADPTPTASTQGGGAGFEEVVVTAQKREERLQDVPVPATAITGASLLNNNQARLQDYFGQIPGLSYAPGFFPGSPFIVIRGITTGASSTANPTVGVMIDDTPYGSSTGLGGGGFGAPDIDPSDLQRVEVLRGPQGTLYGASSMGGLIKYVTVDPSLDRFSGRLQAGTSGITNGNGLGYNVRGSFNEPLSDAIAIRASGFFRDDPGYIDDPILGLMGTNKAHVYGGRLAALYRPTDAWSIKLSALLQRNRLDGLPYIQPSLGDLKQSFSMGSLVTDTDSDAYSITVSGKVGRTDITAISGYGINKNYSVLDYTPFIGPALNLTEFGVPNTLTKFVTNAETKKFTQEIRFSTPIGERVDTLLGLFYTHENSPKIQSIYAVNPAADGATVGDWVDFVLPASFTEYAIFADVTYHFTDRFDVQVGARQSFGRLTAEADYIGPYATAFLHKPSPFDNPSVTTKANPFTYLFTPRFTVSPDLMFYARLASGYRPGGPNTSAAALGVPPNFAPDKTFNYEVGTKGDLFDHVISVDASLYYIDWRNIQIFLREPTTRLVYYANGGDAKSEGAELSIEARPVSGLSILAWAAWNEAVLKDALPKTSSTAGAAGSPLPFSARFTGALSVNQSFALWSTVEGFVGASVNYIGDRTGVFTATAARQDLPAYAQANVNIGLTYASWTANLYANNVADRRGVISGGLGDTYTNKFTFIPPRTLGVSVTKTF